MKKYIVIFIIALGLIVLFYRTDLLHGEFSLWNTKSEVQLDEQVTDIEITTTSGTTMIIPEHNRKTVYAEFTGLEDVSVNKRGKKVIIKEKEHWFPIKWNRQLRIYIPADYNKNITSKMTSGKFVFSNQTGDQIALATLTVQMTSGKMDLQNMMVDYLHLQGSSGKIMVDHVTAKKGTVKIQSGNATLTDYTGELEANVTSGKFAAKIANLRGPLSLHVGSGKAELKLPDDANFNLKGRNGSGKIICEVPLQQQMVNKKSIEGIYGTGEHLLDLHVSSGFIVLRQKTPSSIV